LGDDIIAEQRGGVIADRGGAGRGFDPKGIDDIGIPVAAARALGLVEIQQGLLERLAGPGHLAPGKVVERVSEFLQIHRFHLGLDDEPGHRIEIDAHYFAAEAQSFHNGGAAAHKGIEDHLALGIGIVAVVAIELGHDVGAGRL